MAGAPRCRSPDSGCIPGVYQNQKQKAFTGFFWGRCFDYHGGIGEEKVLGWNSTGRATGAQPTKFQEKTLHTGIQRSAVSRFIWNVRRERKRVPESDEGVNIAISSESNAATNDGEGLFRSFTYPRESRHVSEDLEAFCKSGSSDSSKFGLPNLQGNADEVHLSDDEDSGNSPKSLLDGHFSDIKIDPVSTRPVLKPCKCVGNDESYPGKYDTSCLFPIRKDRLLLEPGFRPIENTFCVEEECKPHRNHAESKLPTGIVVLKPTHQKQHKSVEGDRKVPLRRKVSLYSEGFYIPESHEASEVARAVTRRTRDACLKSSCCRRYSRCQHSYNGYSGEFGVETDVLKMQRSCDNWRCSSSSFNARDKLGLEPQMFKLPLRGDKRLEYKSFRSFSAHAGECRAESDMLLFPLKCGKWCTPPSSSPSEWSANMITKRVLERWKVTDRYRELEFGDCGQTLAMSGGKVILTNLDSISKLDIIHESRFGGYNRSVSDGFGMPYCDGRKVDKHMTLSRSMSFPYSGSGRSQRKSFCNRALFKNKHIVVSRLQLCGRNKHIRESIIVKENQASPYSSNSRTRISQSAKTRHFSVVSAQFELKMEASIKSFCEQPCMSQISTKIGCTLSSDAEKEIKFTNDKEELCIQCHEAGRTSSDNPKGTDRSDLLLGSEACFKQCKSSDVEDVDDLTAFEVKEVEEKPKHVDMQSLHHPSSSCSLPSNWDFSQIPIDISPDVEAWECSFALKALAQCGVDKSGLDKIRAFWKHMPDYHRNPSLLDKFETKRNEGTTTRLRSERMLVLDRINIAIMDRFRHQVGIHPWVNPRIAAACSYKDENALVKLIRQESSNGWLPERLRFDPEMVWGDSNRVIDIIGNEIESSLTDDLLGEFLLD